MSLIRRLFPEAKHLQNTIRQPRLGALPSLSLFDDPFFNQAGSVFRQAREPAVDIKETEQNFIVEAEVPGWKKENTELSVVNGDTLVISGHHEEQHENKDEAASLWSSERSMSSFRRFFSFPTDVKGEDINASLKDGILTVNVPKVHREADVKKIEIHE
ncbi:hypothetical protein HK098_005417 [Nowakowskiella sp. JEL0407]|nr:hypothetical protein HK098_005417 [Nowakowskiella sp. JEL0407]